MARIKLEFPEPAIFSTDLDVRASDLNYGGHVGNDRFLSLVQEARIQLFQSLGFNNEAQIAGNIGMIVTDAAVVYKSELFLGDNLRIQISIADENKYGFDFYYRILNTKSGRIGAIAKTGVVGFNYDTGKITGFPKEFFMKLATLN